MLAFLIIFLLPVFVGAGALAYRGGLNGSVADIAGVLSENRRVLGMMPHPERMIEPAHGGSDGRKLFESVLHGLNALA